MQKKIFETLEEVKLKNDKKPIGTGAFSEVKLAYNEKNPEKLYAMKSLLKKDPVETLYIKKEQNLHKSLDHPYIIKFEDYLETETHIHFFLEYASNGDLFEYLRKEKVNKYQLKKFFYQTCLAIKYLHSKKIMHRDLKPENLLITHDLNLKLCDFGWSVIFEEENERKTLCGTYEYMAPEVYFGKLQTFKTDIWALGILLYELFHGKPPFVIKKHNENMIEPKFDKIRFKSDLEDSMKDLVKNLLVVDPVKRFCIDKLLDHAYFEDIRIYEDLENIKKENKISKEIFKNNNIENDIVKKEKEIFKNENIRKEIVRNEFDKREKFLEKENIVKREKILEKENIVKKDTIKKSKKKASEKNQKKKNDKKNTFRENFYDKKHFGKLNFKSGLKRSFKVKNDNWVAREKFLNIKKKNLKQNSKLKEKNKLSKKENKKYYKKNTFNKFEKYLKPNLIKKTNRESILGKLKLVGEINQNLVHNIYSNFEHKKENKFVQKKKIKEKKEKNEKDLKSENKRPSETLYNFKKSLQNKKMLDKRKKNSYNNKIIKRCQSNPLKITKKRISENYNTKKKINSFKENSLKKNNFFENKNQKNENRENLYNSNIMSKNYFSHSSKIISQIKKNQINYNNFNTNKKQDIKFNIYSPNISKQKYITNMNQKKIKFSVDSKYNKNEGFSCFKKYKKKIPKNSREKNFENNSFKNENNSLRNFKNENFENKSFRNLKNENYDNNNTPEKIKKRNHNNFNKNSIYFKKDTPSNFFVQNKKNENVNKNSKKKKEKYRMSYQINKNRKTSSPIKNLRRNISVDQNDKKKKLRYDSKGPVKINLNCVKGKNFYKDIYSFKGNMDDVYNSISSLQSFQGFKEHEKIKTNFGFEKKDIKNNFGDVLKNDVNVLKNKFDNVRNSNCFGNLEKYTRNNILNNCSNLLYPNKENLKNKNDFRNVMDKKLLHNQRNESFNFALKQNISRY